MGFHFDAAERSSAIFIAVNPMDTIVADSKSSKPMDANRLPGWIGPILCGQDPAKDPIA